MISQPLNFRRIVAKYCADVTSGKLVTGLAEKSVVHRHYEDLRKWKEDRNYPFRFNSKLAESCCEFFSYLEHTDGEYAGTKFILAPWQAFIVWNLFGWVRKDTGYRRFGEAFISVARGNGKTPFGAAMLLLLFACDSPLEERCEVYTAATKRDQAGLSFRAAKRFVEKNKHLQSRISIFDKRMQMKDDSTFAPLSSDANSTDGLNVHGLLRDEVHAWTEYQREYYEKLDTSLGKRRQPLAITITTAGSEESHIWREQYDIAKVVIDPNDPTTMDHLFVYIAEIDDDDDELDERCWPKANPMLASGVVKIDHLRELSEKAKIKPAFRHQLRRYHCNKLTYSAHKLFTEELWARGNDKLPEITTSTKVYCGVDLGWIDDLAAIGYCTPVDWIRLDGSLKRRYAVWCDIWIPRGTNRDLTREPFSEWIRTKRITVTEAECTDTEPMYERLAQWKKRSRLKSLAYDQAHAKEFSINCVNKLRIKSYAFAQKPHKYNEPLNNFEACLREGRIIHGGDPVLMWAAMNVMAEVNHEGLRMPAKKRSADKIDPFVAVLMAFNEAVFDDTSKPSKYETQEPVVLGW